MGQRWCCRFSAIANLPMKIKEKERKVHVSVCIHSTGRMGCTARVALAFAITRRLHGGPPRVACRELMRSKSSWQLDANSNSRVHTGATREFNTQLLT